jgi:HK97 gp10 family phage protein
MEISIQNKVIRTGLVSAINPVKKDMKSFAPKKSGELSRSINHRTLNNRQKARLGIDNSSVAVLAGPNKKVNGENVNWRANFIESGVKSHTIKPKEKGGKLRIGNKILANEVYHPGVKANPFMEKAIDNNQQNIPNLFYQGMAKTLNKIRAQ